MRVDKTPISKIVFLFCLFMTLIPVQNVLGFEAPAIYMFIVIWMYLFLFVLVGRVKIFTFARVIIFFFIIIILEIILSTLVGTISTYGRFYFPNDVIHYVARFLAFLYFYFLIYSKSIKIDYFIKSFLILLIVGMSIGVLQWLPWPGRGILLQLYPFKDGEIQLLQMNRELSFVRIHGWAQFATANGGLGMLSFVYGMTHYLYMKKNKVLSMTLIVLSIINIVISQARAGMLALLISIVVLYFIHLYVTKKPFKPTIKYFISIGISIYTLRIMYLRGNPFIERIIFRWNALFETSGGARVNQMEYALSLIDSPLKFLLGISRAVQSRSSNVYHIEVEPVNIFVLNGLVGFILQYGLIVILLTYLLIKMKNFRNNKYVTTLLVSSFVMLLSYQFFSIAYFFYREIRTGIIPWILIGATIGAVEYYTRSNKLKSKE